MEIHIENPESFFFVSPIFLFC